MAIARRGFGQGRFWLLMAPFALSLAVSLPAGAAEKPTIPGIDVPDLSDSVLTRARAERRLALVIGNSRYPNALLRKPRQDAQSMAAVLRWLGYEVTLLEDVGGEAMKRAIDAFAERLGSTKAQGLFYYSGHGVQGNAGYLIPVDLSLGADETAMQYRAVSVEYVLHKMERSRDGVDVLIIDACRQNPYVRGVKGGEAAIRPISAGKRSLVAFATRLGAIANEGPEDEKHSVFTQNLLAAILVPGAKIRDVLDEVQESVRAKTQEEQIPDYNSSLGTMPVFFIPVVNGAPTRQVPTEPKPDLTTTPRLSPPLPAPAFSPPQLTPSEEARPTVAHDPMRALQVVADAIKSKEDGKSVCRFSSRDFFTELGNGDIAAVTNGKFYIVDAVSLKKRNERNFDSDDMVIGKNKMFVGDATYSTETGERIAVMDTGWSLNDPKFSPDESLIMGRAINGLGLGGPGKFLVLDAITGSLVRELQDQPRSTLYGICNDNSCYYVEQGKGLDRIDMRTGSLIDKIDFPFEATGVFMDGSNRIAVYGAEYVPCSDSSDGSRNCVRGLVSVFDAGQKGKKKTIGISYGRPRLAAFSPDGRYVVDLSKFSGGILKDGKWESASEDRFHIIDLQTGAVISNRDQIQYFSFINRKKDIAVLRTDCGVEVVRLQ